jgi:hypothetical protein
MDERISAALDAFADLRVAALAASPLANMASWISSGAPPRAHDLRSAGLNGALAPRNASEGKLHFDLRIARKAFIAEWGFSIPCMEAIDALGRYAPIVEIGAGTGYWTALLQSAGVDAIATDKTASGDLGYGFHAGRHAQVSEMSAEDAVLHHAARTPFCSWPTQGENWALTAVSRLSPERVVAFVGGSATGTPELVRFLSKNFDLIEDVEIPQFPGCDDRLVIYRRRA